MEHLRPLAPAVPGMEGLVEIGRGGAGIVYRGRQIELERDVAVKVVLSSGAPEDATRLWRREVTAMARLSSHPHIVAVYDGGFTDDGLPYLVMPYMPGGTLDERLRSDGTLAGDEVVAIGSKLADALAAAHAAGVLHRDVKPANVLFSPYAEPQLSDFGIAQLADVTATMNNDVHATVAYAAPEVLSGQPASVASDVYSLGATLHACLTGSPPHGSSAGESLLSLAMRVVAEPPADLQAAGVDPRVASVVDRAMAKDPAARFATAAALGEALKSLGVPDASAATVPAAVVATAPVPTLPSPPTEARAPSSPRPTPTARPPGRRPWRGAALGLAAVALLVVALAMAATGGDEGDDGQIAADTTTVTSTPADVPALAADPPTSVDPTPDPATAAAAYIAALQGRDFEGAYAMTTPGFRQAQPFDGYLEFWGGFDTITVIGTPEVDAAAGTVTLRLQLDGSTESYPLELVPGDDGALLIDGPRPR